MPFWITSFHPRTILQVSSRSCHLCKHYVEQALFLTPLDGQREEASASRTLSFKFTPPQFFFNFLKQILTIGNYKGVVKSSFLREFNFYGRPPVQQQSLTCMVFLWIHWEQVLKEPFPLFMPLILSDFRSMPSDYLRPWRPPWAPLPGLPPLPQLHPLLLERQLRWLHQRS